MKRYNRNVHPNCIKPYLILRRSLPIACILLADNSKAIRDTLRRIFLEEGFFFCVDAADGKEALEEAKRARPDIVVLAYRMPKMNGLQAAYAIRQFAPATKIIFYSAVDSPDMAAAARVMGANAFVSKAANWQQQSATIKYSACTVV